MINAAAAESESQSGSKAHTCTVCINASNTVSVNIDERTPLMSSNSTSNYSSTGSTSGDGGRREAGATSGTHPQRRRHRHRHHACHEQLAWLLVPALMIFFLAGVSIATYLLLNEGNSLVPEVYAFDAINTTLLAPRRRVLLMDTSAAPHSESCDNYVDCARIIKSISIVCSFFIDDAGTVYKGSGWSAAWPADGIAVAFIGNRTNTPPSNAQLVSFQRLLKFAVDNNLLADCHSIETQLPNSIMHQGSRWSMCLDGNYIM